MAKDNRVIHRTVRVQKPSADGKSNQSLTFGPNQEDELADVLTEASGQRLLERGAIAGDWEFRGDKTQAVKSPDKAALESANSELAQLRAELAELKAAQTAASQSATVAAAPDGKHKAK
jgi:hypothetical protein